MKRPVALVTGASRGIGHAIALCLAESGFDLVATSTRPNGTASLARKVTKLGRRCVTAHHDLANRDDADRLFKLVKTEFGALDVLVNNAGMVIRRNLVDMSDDDFDRVLNVNLSGVFYLCRRFIPGMIKRGRGRVINVSSISATLGSKGATGYCASKWGLDGLTKSLAEEVRGTGVMIASVLPGSVDTDMLVGSGFEPMMTPQDVASVVKYLCLDAPLAMQGGRVEVFG